MNPLTLVKRIQNINSKEAALGISDEASWHAKYLDSAYVYAGGIPFDLTEGDLLAVFAQYGEIVDVNLVRDKGTGKSKGFAFIAYEDQRSTNLAVDNLNGAQILGRIIRVDHVSKYKKKEEEDEETEQRKREERGVCRAFQRGECNRGAGCKFSHDERRAANTGWGHEEDRRSRWANDKFEGSKQSGVSDRVLESANQEDRRSRWANDKFEGSKQSGVSDRVLESANQEGRGLTDKDSRGSRAKGTKMGSDRHYEDVESSPTDRGRRNYEKRLDRKETDTRHRDDRNDLRDRESRRRGAESNSGEDRNRRDEKRSRKYEDDSYKTNDRDGRPLDRRSTRDKGVSPCRPRSFDDDHRHRSHR